jgi:hypothetical protein
MTRSPLVALLLITARSAVAQSPLAVTLVTDEARAVLDLTATLAEGRPPSDADWGRLFATEGYRRLRQRETSLHRAFTDREFRVFVESADLRKRTAALRATLEDWSRADLQSAAKLALAYLPTGARLRARLYPVIKPATNSFVFEVGTDSAAIFLYVDPAVSRPKLENTLAHELHHIGYASACRDRKPKSAGTLATAEQVMGAFGEGLAMLAAAGGPEPHPHAASDTAERNRWDRDLANAPADLAALETFFTAVIDGRLTGDSLEARGMSFFGVQGPWYTVGYLMARTIEQARGRARLVELICNPARLLVEYDTVTQGRTDVPRWSAEFIDRLRSPR